MELAIPWDSGVHEVWLILLRGAVSFRLANSFLGREPNLCHSGSFGSWLHQLSNKGTLHIVVLRSIGESSWRGGLVCYQQGRSSLWVLSIHGEKDSSQGTLKTAGVNQAQSSFENNWKQKELEKLYLIGICDLIFFNIFCEPPKDTGAFVAFQCKL